MDEKMVGGVILGIVMTAIASFFLWVTYTAGRDHVCGHLTAEQRVQMHDCKAGQ